VEEVARARHGLILGKFMPPHRGHLHLVAEALRRVDQLTLLVCSLGDEPIPGELRVAWLRELVPQARVVHVTDPNPSLPGDDPRFWEKWVATIRRHLPEGPDLVFAGEEYGRELAARLGARAICLDRGLDPVSGSALRARPLAWWDAIPPLVRPWFVRRVVVTGSESTGKTTLAAQLAEHYGTLWVPEYAREYVDALPRPLGREDVEPIARGQLAAEEAASRQANRLLVMDTDVLSTAVYGEHYYQHVPSLIGEALRARPAHLYLLADIDLPWHPDPQRDRGHMREEMQRLFRDAVVGSGVPWVEITGTGEDRLARAVAAVDELLARS
jgi:NadR type nicotinamide-nucleotide adenylyltransferase